MITRRFGFPRLHGVYPAYRGNRAGLIETKMVNGIPHTWAVARPGGMYQSSCAPNYLDVPDKNRGLQNALIRYPSPDLNLPRYNVEMDPSNPQTWQRQYAF